jgi:hypothetical protein
MNEIYVAWQNAETREWVPVAKLERHLGDYHLTYTQGAQRCPAFAGLGRMLDKKAVYVSKELFPFFRNRLVNKSRPEFKDYVRWLDLEQIPEDPIAVLSLTAGLRATDSLELVPPLKQIGESFVLDFFSRGLRYLPPSAVDALSMLTKGERLYLMRDVQNRHDPQALCIRSESSMTIVGYVPRYYDNMLSLMLDNDIRSVVVEVKKANPDAPLDMRLLCRLTAKTSDPRLLELGDDFLTWPARALFVASSPTTMTPTYEREAPPSGQV